MSEIFNINTKSYWESRFSSGNWEVSGGRSQTEQFALAAIPYLNIPFEFAGRILDFGCGLGDAIPVYRQHFPNASLLGMDISETAVEKCRAKYGDLASFFCGDHTETPPADIIIASNVFEHLSNDLEIATSLIERCKTLYVIVPFNEAPLHSEHVRKYKKNSFSELGAVRHKVFLCEGWSQFGYNLFVDIYLKNVARPFIGKSIVNRGRQILFEFKSNKDHFDL